MIFSWGSEIESRNSHRVFNVPVLGHVKLKFFLFNWKIYIGIIESLRQIETDFFFYSKLAVILWEKIELEDTSVTQINKDNLNFVLIVVIEDIVVYFFTSMNKQTSTLMCQSVQYSEFVYSHISLFHKRDVGSYLPIILHPSFIKNYCRRVVDFCQPTTSFSM